MILLDSEEEVEKGDLTRQRREGGEMRSFPSVKRGWRRVILPASEERAEKGNLTSQ